MLKKPILKQIPQVHEFEPSLIPERRKRGRPKRQPEITESKPATGRNMTEVSEEPTMPLINGRDSVNKDSEKGERARLDDEEQNRYKSFSLREGNINKQTQSFKAKKATETEEKGFKDDFDSNFDSPYHGEDKFDLDILDDSPFQEETLGIENKKVQPKNSYAISDKNFFLGRDFSPKLKNNKILEDKSTFIPFEFGISLPDFKSLDIETEKENSTGLQNKETNDKTPTSKTFEELKPESLFGKLSESSPKPREEIEINNGILREKLDINFPFQVNSGAMEIEHSRVLENNLQNIIENNQKEIEENGFIKSSSVLKENNSPFSEKSTLPLREGKFMVEEHTDLKQSNNPPDAKSINPQDVHTKDQKLTSQVDHGKENLSLNSSLVHELLSLKLDPMIHPFNPVVTQHKHTGLFQEESEPLNLGQIQEDNKPTDMKLLELLENKKISPKKEAGSSKSTPGKEKEIVKENKKNQHKAKPFKIIRTPYNYHQEKKNEEKVIQLSKLESKEIRKAIEKKKIAERENTKRMLLLKENPRKNGKSSYDDDRSEGKYGRREQSSDDELEKLFERKIKKKVKFERKEDCEGVEGVMENEATGPGSKSTSSETEHKNHEDFIFKKGTTITRETDKFEFIPYTEDQPRRSLREKREPQKSYDKKLYGGDFGFTFVEYKQHKIEKIKIGISFRALLMMNIHAHLSMLEVIGILGGTVVSEDEIVINEALPCNNISESSNTHSVEMDPTSQVESQEKLEKMSYKTLGWYHSHPTFKSIPSQIDQETHTSHQIHYKDHQYIGVIIGPYHTERASSKTKGEVFVFHVYNNQTYKLNFVVNPDKQLLYRDLQEIKKLISEYRESEKTVNFKEKWRKGMSFQAKLISCIETLFEENLASLGINTPIKEKAMDETDDSSPQVQQEMLLKEEEKEEDFNLESVTDIRRFLSIFQSLLE